MKKLAISLLAITLALIACKKEDKAEAFGKISFASNYHTINCVSKVSVYIDDAYVGDISKPSDAINDCGIDSNVNKELSVGTHTYKVLVGDSSTGNCYKEITAPVNIEADECEKVFVDMNQIFDDYGSVSIGSNYHIVNCITNVAVYIDKVLIGELSKPCNEVTECGLDGNITKDLKSGTHTYKCLFTNPDSGACTHEESGTFTVSKGECKKLFVPLNII